MGTNADGTTVTLDDRGRVTLPKEIRDRLGLTEGDDLALELDDGEVHLAPNRAAFEPIDSGRDGEWGADTFLDAGEATFGDLDEKNRQRDR